MTNIKQAALNIENHVIEMRRHLHMHPELGCMEHETTDYIKKELSSIGIPVTEYEDITGCIGVINGGKPGKTVMLRADIDALPICENTGLPFSSVNEGVMHACGHDCHTAMLLGAAKILWDMRENLCGSVRLIFQMAEEIGRKAEEYVKRGALEDVDAVYGMHVWPEMPSGTFNFEPGERMACSDRFTIRINGVSAHGSAPHLGKDAILAAAAVVQALQSLTSRVMDPLDALVVTVGMMNGGTKQNILADSAEIIGTVRTFNKSFRDSMPERIRNIAASTAQAYGCSAECDYYFGPSPLINDADLVRIAKAAGEEVFGSSAFLKVTKTMGAEDFSVFMEHVPGVYGYIGTRNEEKGITCINHNPGFIVDEDILVKGTELYVRFAEKYLNSGS